MNTNLPLSFRLELLALTLLGWLGIYFLVNRLQVEHDRRLDLGISLDGKIPFIPQFALVYFSTYIFVVQPFFILSNARLFYWMLVSFISITAAATLIHAAVPSKIDRVEQLELSNGISGRALGLFQKTCKPHGNFPSMHVGLSVPVVGANFIVAGPVAGSVTLIWAVLIALSTLYTKQHYILDVLAGALGGILIYSLAFWLMMG